MGYDEVSAGLFQQLYLSVHFFACIFERGKTELLQAKIIYDGSRLWNTAPQAVTQCQSLWSAKKAIKDFVKTLPILQNFLKFVTLSFSHS